MTERSYTLASDEKATEVMIGTPDLLIWADLVTKKNARMSGFLNTLAESFVPLHDANILFLAPTERVAPIVRPTFMIKRELILFFLTRQQTEPLPEESEVRRYEAVEIFIGPYQLEGEIIKSPIASFLNLLLVSKDTYMQLHKATVRHVAKPWLGDFGASTVHLRLDRLGIVADS